MQPRRIAWAAALGGLIALLLSASTASAGWVWCAKDPVVRLGGTDVRIEVAVPADYQWAVNGAIQVDIVTPPGVSQELLFSDDGFNGHGEDVRFATRGPATDADTFAAHIRVKVPTDPAAGGPIPVLLTVTPANGDAVSVEGRSNNLRLTTVFTRTP